MKVSSLLVLLTLTVSFNAFSALVPLTDDEMSEVGGPIIADNTLSVEVERAMIASFKAGDENAAKTIAHINRIVMAARTGRLTHESVNSEFNRFIRTLDMLGVPLSVINAQVERGLYLQEQAARQAALDESRRLIFRALMGNLIEFGNKYRNQQHNPQMVVDFSNIMINFINQNASFVGK
ncbi:hypothetical protein ACJVC5_06205 [Peredibacter sp. HCB2-198]|uniref:hypothetical protein n=1 Tax=Peredibacter sp. HCB2-198 TaxID=3383025 RepID=UPI0038B5B4DD